MFGPVDRIFAPVDRAFAKARTHTDYRHATFGFARHMLTTFTPQPAASIIDHGALRAPIRLPDGSYIATEDTELLEVYDNKAQRVHAVSLAANADVDSEADANAVFGAVSMELNKILLDWSDAGKVTNAFGVVVVRTKVAFFEYRDEWRRW